MRALTTFMLLVAATGSAPAHVLDADHAVAEQIGHQLASPHHLLFILPFIIGVALLAGRFRAAADRARRRDT